jgi:hypothetical protein
VRSAIVATLCVCLGCTYATWKPATPQDDPAGREALLVTADRAVVIENAQRSAGRVGGHVVRMWQVPAGPPPLPVGDNPDEIARRARWRELPAPSFFSAAAASLRRIRVTRLTTISWVAIVAGSVIYAVGVLVVGFAMGAAGSS